MRTQINVTIPFAGFYESWHSYNIDRAEESITQDDSGEPMFSLFEHVNIDYRQIHLAYAQAYVESFSDNFEIPLTYEAMDSPREYNFTTDRLFANIDLVRFYLCFRKVRNDGSLTEYAAKRFTSCDGFSSFYSPTWQDWGPFREWDHNQLGTVLCAFVNSDGEEFSDWESMEAMEGYECNGYFDTWIWDAMPDDDSKRIGRVIDYMRARQKRQWRTTLEMRTANLPFSSLPLGQSAKTVA